MSPGRTSLTAFERVLRGRTPESKSGALRRAAVAAILRETSAEPEVLLIKRAERSGDRWSGHMAFPGGLAEPGDADLVATAIRETREEIGVDLALSARLLGRLDDTEAIARGRPTDIVITPFVFAATRELVIAPNEEVDEALWAPLGPMLRGENVTVRPYEHEGRELGLPAFDVDGRLVWGLTHRMLCDLLDLVR